MGLAGWVKGAALPLAAWLLAAGPGAAAQVAPPVALSAEAAWGADAAEYAKAFGVPGDEAYRRLRALEASVPATDRLQQRWADRQAGIAVEHVPALRIVVLLTGDVPVAPEVIDAGGVPVPVVFRTGAAATRLAMIAAIHDYQAAIRAMLPHPPGLGVDMRTGSLAVMVHVDDLARFAPGELNRRIAALTGMPVRVRAVDRPGEDFGVEGGARLVGVNPADGRRYSCTTGFTVHDGVRTGVVTAAHCPDTLAQVAPDRTEVPLEFAGQWGWGYQDVQLHLSPAADAPVFLSDTAKTRLRAVSGTRSRLSTRAGDWACHRGERTGYSCAEVELVDFAPSGDLCGGACLPSWVTVRGPGCRGGDSGGPVFVGTVALGILKGGSYRVNGKCGFYYYMAVDYLPQGWRVQRVDDRPPVATPLF